MKYFNFLLVSAAIGQLSFGSSSLSAQGVTFAEICALETTVNCWGFESEAELFYTWFNTDEACVNDPFLNNHPNGNANHMNVTTKPTRDGRCIYPKRDQTYAASGTSSLKFVYNQPTGSNPSGNFSPNFKRTGEGSNATYVQFGKGGEFWVRFSMRQSQGLLDFNGLTEAGKTSALKRVIVHGFSSASSLEETIVDWKTHKIMRMYSDQGQEDYGAQDNIGCTVALKNDNFPSPPCRYMVANQWRSYQIHVIVADNAERNNGIVELYIDDEIIPIISISDSSMQPGKHPTDVGAPYPLQPLPYTETADWLQTNGYGKVTFTLFHTGKDAITIPASEAAMWIDDVVISKIRVPALDGTGTIDSVAPAEPADLTTQ